MLTFRRIVGFAFLTTLYSVWSCGNLTLGILLTFENMDEFKVGSLKLAKYDDWIIPKTIDLINKNKSILTNRTLRAYAEECQTKVSQS